MYSTSRETGSSLGIDASAVPQCGSAGQVASPGASCVLPRLGQVSPFPLKTSQAGQGVNVVGAESVFRKNPPRSGFSGRWSRPWDSWIPGTVEPTFQKGPGLGGRSPGSSDGSTTLQHPSGKTHWLSWLSPIHLLCPETSAPPLPRQDYDTHICAGGHHRQLKGRAGVSHRPCAQRRQREGTAWAKRG